jgi:hypothetical protein
MIEGFIASIPTSHCSHLWKWKSERRILGKPVHCRGVIFHFNLFLICSFQNEIKFSSGAAKEQRKETAGHGEKRTLKESVANSFL